MNADRATAGLYLGLISGTSMDGIDAAIVRLGEQRCDVVAAECVPYPQPLRDALLAASRRPETCTVDEIGGLDHAIGERFALAALEVLEASGCSRRDVRAIGSHGQTLRHRPDGEQPYTLQIGDPNIIAARTGIDVVADFRRRDMAEGGQGAPLTPAFHRWLFADRGTNRLVLNIGGIANVTVLPAGGDSPSGFDTGPGNGLMD
ncbi:MAG: anhydro-N-acetylmuramic acid kinase, partial [Woeseiaceae bacterium]